MDDLARERVSDGLLSPHPSASLADPAGEPSEPILWANRVRDALARQSGTALGIAEEALRQFPGEFELLLLAALAALAAGHPVRALGFIRRHQKRYVPGKAVSLLLALAFAQQRQFPRAWAMLRMNGIDTLSIAARCFVGADVMLPWLRDRLAELRLEQHRAAIRRTAPPPTQPRAPVKPPPPRQQRAGVTAVAPALSVPDLPRLDASFNVQVEIANTQAIVLDGTGADMGWFGLRGELTRLNLFEGFDDLLCLPALRGVDTHWYQVETVRKVLKQYRGRVLLADEVGLGKTVEAGMVLKEYALRGMAERILILTPASLVGQWRDEMESKFGIDLRHQP